MTYKVKSVFYFLLFLASIALYEASENLQTDYQMYSQNAIQHLSVVPDKQITENP